MGQYSAGSIATCYRLDGLRIKSQWGRDLPHLPRWAPGTTQPPIQWVSYFLGVKWVEHGVNNPPSFSAEVKERVEPYILLPLRAFMACSRVNFFNTIISVKPTLHTNL